MTRGKLPDRRGGENVSFAYRDRWYVVSLSRYEDGRVAEVFSHVHSGDGSDRDHEVRDAAILLSLALQFGVPMETVAHAITRDDKGRASSLIGTIVDRIGEMS